MAAKLVRDFAVQMATRLPVSTASYIVDEADKNKSSVSEEIRALIFDGMKARGIEV